MGRIFNAKIITLFPETNIRQNQISVKFLMIYNSINKANILFIQQKLWIDSYLGRFVIRLDLNTWMDLLFFLFHNCGKTYIFKHF